MTRYKLLTGDAVEQLEHVPAATAHCCVTSPPYFGLRDYGNDGQIGLEPSVGEYVDRLVAVFRAVRRVLRPDGVLFLNLGDTYCGGGGGPDRLRKAPGSVPMSHPSRGPTDAIKELDLFFVPHTVALALRADGWYARAEIVWAKPNPLPESITSRPTKSHEFVFMLTPSPDYFYDAEAIRERGVTTGAAELEDHDRNVDQRGLVDLSGTKEAHAEGTRTGANLSRAYKDVDWSSAGRNARSVWEISSQPFRGAHFATMPTTLAERCIMAGSSERGVCEACGAPLRRIVERGAVDRDSQRLAGSDAAGGYSGESVKMAEDYARLKARQDARAPRQVQSPAEVKARILAGMRMRRTAGWDWTCGEPMPCPTCEGTGTRLDAAGEEDWCRRCRRSGEVGTGHGARAVPAVILDPFSGAGTTGVAALRLGRSYVGVELSPEYQEKIARPRLEAVARQSILPFGDTGT